MYQYDFDEFVSQFQAGKMATIPEYLSTSADKRIAFGFSGNKNSVMIDVVHSSGKSVTTISSHAEWEVIIPRNKTFIVKDVKLMKGKEANEFRGAHFGTTDNAAHIVLEEVL